MAARTWPAISAPPALVSAWQAIVRLCVGTETRRLIFRSVVLAAAVRLAILAGAWLTMYIVVGREGQGFGNTMLEMFKRWDANQFERISEHGYPTSGDYQELIAYPPLYPFAVRALEFIIPSWLVAGLLISAICSVAAGYFIQAIVRVDGGDDAEASRSLWYFFLFPTAYFLAQPYTEAMFMALILGSFYFARKGQWWAAGILAGFSTICRLQGVVIVPALALEAFHQDGWKLRSIKFEQIACCALASTGFLAYLGLNYYLHSDFFAFVDYEDKAWFHHFIYPWEDIKETILWMKGSPGFLRSSIYETRLVATVVVALTLVIGVRWLRPSYQLFGWLALLMFLSVSYQISLPRYALSIFPMYFVFARLGRNIETNQALLTISALLMGVLYVIYAYRWGF